MDNNGQVIIEPKYKIVSSFIDVIAYVKDDNANGYLVDKNDNKISNVQGRYVEVHDGLWLMRLDDKWGYIDKTGKWVIKPTFQVTGKFKDEYAIVGKYDKSNNLKEGIIDEKGQFIVGTKYDEIYLNGFDKSGFIFRENGLYGVLSLTGTVTIAPKYTLFIDHSDHKIFMDKNTIYFLDENLNIKNKYNLGKVFPLYYDNKLISIMTKDGKLVKKIDTNKIT